MPHFKSPWVSAQTIARDHFLNEPPNTNPIQNQPNFYRFLLIESHNLSLHCIAQIQNHDCDRPISNLHFYKVYQPDLNEWQSFIGPAIFSKRSINPRNGNVLTF